ncbi:MAG: T9SS type A sorting domain-containing protein [Bacteroidia bacterium]
MGSDWPQQAKLTASDGDMNDNFGWSTGITDNYAIVGAPNNTDAGFATGAAYIFERTGSTWTELAKLLAPTSKGGDFFGYSVAIADEYAVVGALGNDDEGTQAGAAYVYMRSGSVWTLVDTLYATDPDVNDYFGFSVDIDEDGENIIVGAPRNDDGGSNSGAAYVYHRSGSVWMSEGKLLATDDDAQDSLGFSVAIAGDYAIAGAIGDDETASNAGAAYIFNRSGGVWSQQEKLMASDGSSDDLFGYSVGTDGMWAAVGAPFEDDSAMDAGALYAFLRSGGSWTETAKYKAADPDMNDEMGLSSAVSDGRAIVGIPGDDTKAPNAGAACIINLSGSAAPAASPMLVPDNEDNFLTSLEDVSAEEEAGLEAVADEETEEEIGTETIENRIVTTQLPYPNPTRGEFNFMLHSDEPGDVRLEIVSMSGKLVLRDMLQVHQGNTTHRIDLSREKGGIYLVNLFFSNGERVMHRVVVQR